MEAAIFSIREKSTKRNIILKKKKKNNKLMICSQNDRYKLLYFYFSKNYVFCFGIICKSVKF